MYRIQINVWTVTFLQWMLVVAQISQLLLTLTCEVRPVHFGKEALDPGFALISVTQINDPRSGLLIQAGAQHNNTHNDRDLIPCPDVDMHY